MLRYILPEPPPPRFPPPSLRPLTLPRSRTEGEGGARKELYIHDLPSARSHGNENTTIIEIIRHGRNEGGGEGTCHLTRVRAPIVCVERNVDVSFYGEGGGGGGMTPKVM